jgi:hypothetical protein
LHSSLFPTRLKTLADDPSPSSGGADRFGHDNRGWFALGCGVRIADRPFPVNPIQSLLARIDRWQRANRIVAPTYGVIKKFGDDEVNQLVVGLGWYGFVAIYPLLLVVITRLCCID